MRAGFSLRGRPASAPGIGDRFLEDGDMRSAGSSFLFLFP